MHAGARERFEKPAPVFRAERLDIILLVLQPTAALIAENPFGAPPTPFRRRSTEKSRPTFSPVSSCVRESCHGNLYR